MALGPRLAMPDVANGFQNDFIARLARTFAHVTGRDLFAEAGMDPAAPGISAWNGGFALLTHRGGTEAVLNYGNRYVLDLWEMDWAQFTATPSSATAPEEGVEERRQMMATVARDGFVSGYTGTRISRSGRLFIIKDVTIWRLEDAGGSFGVAAFFKAYEYVRGPC